MQPTSYKGMAYCQRPQFSLGLFPRTVLGRALFAKQPLFYIRKAYVKLAEDTPRAESLAAVDQDHVLTTHLIWMLYKIRQDFLCTT